MLGKSRVSNKDHFLSSKGIFMWTILMMRMTKVLYFFKEIIHIFIKYLLVHFMCQTLSQALGIAKDIETEIFV